MISCNIRSRRLSDCDLALLYVLNFNLFIDRVRSQERFSAQLHSILDFVHLGVFWDFFAACNVGRYRGRNPSLSYILSDWGKCFVTLQSSMMKCPCCSINRAAWRINNGMSITRFTTEFIGVFICIYRSSLSNIKSSAVLWLNSLALSFREIRQGFFCFLQMLY